MGRYFEFGTGNTFDFPTRADFSKRIEYFDDFVLGGGRDRRAYGLVRITPSLRVAYDVNGLTFLKYVLGHTDTSLSVGTIVPQSTIPSTTYKVTVDDESMSISDAKVDTWEITIEEGNPVRAEFSVIGKGIGTSAASVFNPDFSNMPILPHECTLKVNKSINSLWTRLSVRISNDLSPIFKTSSVPVDIREQGLSITGRLRAPQYSEWASEGSVDLIIGSLGTIILHQVKFTEVPPSVTGYDLPETEIAFTAYPTASTTAITAIVSGNKW